MLVKDSVIGKIIEVEGGYVDDPSDSGGKTKYGITEAVARNSGYEGDMRDLPYELAFEIYADQYWNPLHLDDIVEIAPDIAEELCDTAVNMGVGRAAEFLQTALNVLNRVEKDYDDLSVDSSIGPATLRAFDKFIGFRGPDGELVLVRMLNSLQGAFYVKLALDREKDEKFIFGWFLNRVVI